jgi:hypothetical protein
VKLGGGTLHTRISKRLFDREEKIRLKKLQVITMTIHDSKLKGIRALLGREHVPRTHTNNLEKNHVKQLRITHFGDKVRWQRRKDARHGYGLSSYGPHFKPCPSVFDVGLIAGKRVGD